ncbi:ATP-binding protein [Chloroflexota bacterium]
MITDNSEQLISLAMKYVADIVWIVDLDNQLLYISPSVEQVLGYSVEEAMKQSVEDVFTTHSLEVILQMRAALVNSSAEEPPEPIGGNILEMEMYHKDGSIISVEYNGNLILSDDGQPIGSLGVVRNITNIKRLNTELEIEIQKRAEFARFLIHELKTPLTSILASTELLLESNLQPPYDRAVQVISRTSSELNKRISELLDLTRSEIGRLQIKPRRINPKILVSEIVSDIELVVLSNNQKLRNELPSSLPYIKADKQRLRQVIMNLIDNAIKFTPEQGEIVINSSVEGDFLQIHIHNSGIGISKNNQVLLFEPYYSVTVESQRIQGLGLGLALSKQIIESHGGQIWVNSEIDKGTTFSFSIPLSDH